MDSKYKDDERLLSEIKVGDERLLKNLFQSYWKPFKAFVIKVYDLTDEEIVDVYNRSFTTFYFNIRDGKLVAPLKSKLKTYLFGIGRNYIRKIQEKKRKEQAELSMDFQEVQNLFQQPNIVDFYELEWQKKLVEKLLNKLGEGCKKILILSFIEENADDAIMEKMQLPSEGAVRQRRFSCLEKLRKSFKEKQPKSLNQPTW